MALMRAERAFPLRRPLSQDHGFGRFLARRLVAGSDWALVQLCQISLARVSCLTLLPIFVFFSLSQFPLKHELMEFL